VKIDDEENGMIYCFTSNREDIQGTLQPLGNSSALRIYPVSTPPACL